MPDVLFEVHKLNDVGIAKANGIATFFDALLMCMRENCPSSREFTIGSEKLEEACFYFKKALARDPQNQLKP